MTSLRTSRAFGLFAIGLAGCGSLLGLDDFTDAKPGSGAGGASTTSTAGGGTGGAGGASTSAGGASPTGGSGGMGGGSTSQGGTGGIGGTSPTGGAGGTGGSGGSGGSGGTGGTGGIGGSGGSSPQCGLQDQPCCANDSCVGQLLGCSDGTCKCTGLVCNGECVNSMSVNSCGSCENKCDPATEYCSSSFECTCDKGEHCGGACTNTQEDPSNCGGCDLACAVGAKCEAGICKCPVQAAVCSGVCTDLETDADNCGSCGRSCLGGACENGQCAPAVVTSVSGIPQVLVADKERIYWIAGTVIYAAPTKGGPWEKRVSETDPIRDLAVDNDYLYWTVPGQDKVKRAALDGSGSEITVAQEFPGNGPTRIALDTTNVYWRAPNGIRTAMKVGVNQSPTAVSPSGVGDGPLATLDTAIYWTYNGALWQAVFKSGAWTSSELKTGLGAVYAMATTSDSVFWSQWDQSWLMRADLDGMNPINAGVGQAKAMVSRGGDVYWSHSNNSIKMYSTNDLLTRDVIQLASPPIGLAIDDKAIYWATSTAIMKLAR
jgi:hypothetical protein